MTIEGLKYINDAFTTLGIPYEFERWTKGLSFPYCIGEYTETESIDEDGLEEGTFLLTMTTNESYLTLEVLKQMVKDYFPSTGRTAILDSGSGIAVSYGSSFPVDTGEQGLNRMQVNLNVKEWRI